MSLDGHLLRKAEEYDEIYQYFSQAFAATDASPARPGTAVAPTEAEAQQAVLALKGGKAVPKHSMPADIWKLCSQSMSTHFVQRLENSQQQRILPPQELADCELTLLPKPGKTSRRPKDLRPLGLQDPSAKVYAMVLRQRLLDIVLPRVMASNQYAYFPGKSIDQAIGRVSSFCATVRERIRVGVLSVHQRRQGRHASSCYGGIMLSIDLSRAFDTLTRAALLASMSAASVPEDLCQAVLQIHNQCTYTVRHHQQEGRFDMQVGVRQGCALSALQYALYTVHLMGRVAARTSQEWAQAFFTAFADDKHLAWHVETLQDLAFVCRCVSITFELLAQDGMCINPEKSRLVVSLRGSAASRWMRLHSRQTPTGVLINLGTPISPTWIPRVNSIVYLGIVASFQGFELQTLRHRLQAASQNRHRLLKVLHSRVLTIHERVRLYVACVRSSLLYGLHATGLTAPAIRKLEAFDIRSLRAISKSPVHIPKESNVQLRARLKVCTPTQCLDKLLLKRISTLPDVDKPWFSKVQQALEAANSQSTQTVDLHFSPAGEPGIPCPECGVAFCNPHSSIP